MGTNFYWLPGSDERLHIGKRSGAGNGECSWSLQGQRWADTAIDSWLRWKACLRVTGKVVDEYGRKHDVGDFIAEVERTTPENRRRQYDWIQAHLDDPITLSMSFDNWLCADGFSFTFRDFS